MGLFRRKIRRWLQPAEYIGFAGEKSTVKVLQKLGFFGIKGKILQNLYVPLNNGDTTEIDVLFLTRKGVFVVESKNYAGYIFGNEERRNWTVTLYAGKDWLGRKKVEKHSFYNPVWQNAAHIRAVERYLGSRLRAFSVIVFSPNCKLMDVCTSSPGLLVCTRNYLRRNMRKGWRVMEDVYCEEDIEFLYEALLPLTCADAETRMRHVERIREKEEHCPRCGGELVLRTARNGPQAGHQFLGCSGYPKCRYTRNMD